MTLLMLYEVIDPDAITGRVLFDEYEPASVYRQGVVGEHGHAWPVRQHVFETATELLAFLDEDLREIHPVLIENVELAKII